MGGMTVLVISSSSARRTLRRWALAYVLCCASSLWSAPAPVSAQPPVDAALPETGAVCEELASFDRLMRSFLCEHKVPGGSLAVTRHGRLVYARGFGYADVERGEPVQPDSLFRIASVSKPITAAAVLQLVDRGKLRLDDRVWSILSAAPGWAGPGYADPHLGEITVRQVLQHRGGWDREASEDPMFRTREIATQLGIQPPAASRDIVRYMLGRPLDFEPGARYAYSNYGYCVLGRVIEQVTGTDYESYVRTELLAPLGIHRMQIGRTLPVGRAAGEVRYYEPHSQTGPSVFGTPLDDPVPAPYGTWYLEAMDAHGGWIASAIDLVRFAARLEVSGPAGTLSECSQRAMIARPPGAAGREADGALRQTYYGLGWMVRPVGGGGGCCNVWHAGLLPGSSSLLVIRHDGLCWAVVFNSSATAGGRAPADEIDALVHQAADAVEAWPAEDQFPTWLQF